MNAPLTSRSGGSRASRTSSRRGSSAWPTRAERIEDNGAAQRAQFYGRFSIAEVSGGATFGGDDRLALSCDQASTTLLSTSHSPARRPAIHELTSTPLRTAAVTSGASSGKPS